MDPHHPQYSASLSRRLSISLPNCDSMPTDVKQVCHSEQFTRVILPVTVGCWLLFGMLCTLCINRLSRGWGWWAPGWYRTGSHSRCQQTLLVLWWVAGLLFWPLLLPALAIRGVIKCLGWCVLIRPGPLLSFLKTERARKRAERLAREKEEQIVGGVEAALGGDVGGVPVGGGLLVDVPGQVTDWRSNQGANMPDSTPATHPGGVASGVTGGVSGGVPGMV